jgi:endoglucanase
MNPLVRGLLLLVLLLAGCEDAAGPDTRKLPASLQPVSAAELQGPPGFPLADTIAVKVLDRNGNPVPGVAVRFAVTAGGGSVSPGSATSDQQGMARAVWTLGMQPGPNTLTASVERGADPVQFSATARWGPERQVAVVSGSAQRMPRGCALPEPLLVRVTEAQGAPVSGAKVFFAAGEGARVAPEVASTDAQGIARAIWTLGATPGEQRATASIATEGRPTATFMAGAERTAPNGYATIGSTVYSTATCRPHHFHGMARPSLHWWPDDERLRDPKLAAEDFSNIRGWGANMVKISLNQRFWQFDLKSADRTYRKEEYRALVDSTVARARRAGLDVLLVLHNSDRGDPGYAEYIDSQQMADVNHSVPFWKDVATRYRGDGGVVFQLYGEPHEISWEVWRNGGRIPAGPSYPGDPHNRPAYEAAGMQQLYDAVRGTGADNLVVVTGMHWGFDLSRVPEYQVKGHNVVYAAHPYDWPDKQRGSWEAAFGRLASTHPVMLAEFGDYKCNAGGYTTEVLNYADQKKLHWVAWAWWTPPPAGPSLTEEQRRQQICKFPALITDWAGTPSPTGQVVKARLQSYQAR